MSRNTKHRDPVNPLRTMFILRWKVAGAVNPKGRRLYYQFPSYVLTLLLPGPVLPTRSDDTSLLCLYS